jgi:hypothetical protein
MNYPITRDTADSLFQVSNNATSTLLIGTTNSATTLFVTSVSTFPSGRFIASVAQELIIISSKSTIDNSLVVEQRGAFGTNAVSHAANVRVNVNITANHYETLRDAIISVQDNTWTTRTPVVAYSNTPPVSPADGEFYLVGKIPTGIWSAHAGKIAFYDAGWTYITPELGFNLNDISTGLSYTYTSDGWKLSGGSTFIKTTLKTANYTAAINDLVACDSTGGSFVVTMPNIGLLDGDVVAVVDIAGTFGAFPVTVTAGTLTTKINGVVEDLSLDISGTYIEFLYNLATDDWRLLETPHINSVNSVFGRGGTIVAVDGDYTASQVTFVPVGQLTAIQTQAAIAEVYALSRTQIISVTGDYTITALVGTILFLVDTALGNVAITLPTALDNEAKYMFKKITDSNLVIITPALGETVDSGTTATLVVVDESISLASDGTNWRII